MVGRSRANLRLTFANVLFLKVKDERINELRAALDKSHTSLDKERNQLAVLSADRNLADDQARMDIEKVSHGLTENQIGFGMP